MLNDLLNRIPESVSLYQIYIVFAAIWWIALVLWSCFPLPPLSFYRRRTPRPGPKSKPEE